MSKNRYFKMLSLDGGGVRGIFSARVLDLMNRNLDIDVHNAFDLVVGTSTGSIIAAACGDGIRPVEAGRGLRKPSTGNIQKEKSSLGILPEEQVRCGSSGEFPARQLRRNQAGRHRGSLDDNRYECQHRESSGFQVFVPEEMSRRRLFQGWRDTALQGRLGVLFRSDIFRPGKSLGRPRLRRRSLGKHPGACRLYRSYKQFSANPGKHENPVHRHGEYQSVLFLFVLERITEGLVGAFDGLGQGKRSWISSCSVRASTQRTV